MRGRPGTAESTGVSTLGNESLPTAMMEISQITITSRREAFTMSDHEDMLALAQQKFDEIRRRAREQANEARFDRIRGRNRQNQVVQEDVSPKTNYLLSTLLYLSLMMHRVEDMKQILQHHNGDSYREWRQLFDNLHSPVFNMQERKIQDERVKRIYSRKSLYKGSLDETKKQLDEHKEYAAKMQSDTNTTAQHMSNTISRLTDENKSITAMLLSKQHVEVDLSKSSKEVEMLHIQLSNMGKESIGFKQDVSRFREHISSLETDRSKLMEKISSNEATIKGLRQQVDDKEGGIHKLNRQLESTRKDHGFFAANINGELSATREKAVSLEASLGSTKAFLSNTQQQLQEKNEALDAVTRNKDAAAEKYHNDYAAKSQEYELTMAELIKTVEELNQVRIVLNDRESALTQASGTLSAEAEAQKELREMLTAKDANTTQLHEKLEETAKAASCDLKEAKEETELTRKALGEKQVEIARATEQLAHMSSTQEQMKEALVGKKNETRKLHERLEESTLSISKLESKISTLVEKSSDTKERLESNKNLVSKLENEHHQQKEHVSQLNSELKDTYKELEESKRSIVQLENERIHVAHMKKQIAACQQENAELKETLSSLEEEHLKFKEQVSRNEFTINGLRQQVDDKETYIEKLDEKLDSTRNESGALVINTNSELSAAREKAASLEAYLESTKKVLSDMQQQLENRNVELENTSRDRDAAIKKHHYEYATKSQAYEVTKTELRKTAEELKDMRQALISNESFLAQASGTLAAESEAQKELRKMLSAKDYEIKQLHNTLQETVKAASSDLEKAREEAEVMRKALGDKEVESARTTEQLVYMSKAQEETREALFGKKNETRQLHERLEESKLAVIKLETKLTSLEEKLVYKEDQGKQLNKQLEESRLSLSRLETSHQKMKISQLEEKLRESLTVVRPSSTETPNDSGHSLNIKESNKYQERDSVCQQENDLENVESSLPQEPAEIKILNQQANNDQMATLFFDTDCSDINAKESTANAQIEVMSQPVDKTEKCSLPTSTKEPALIEVTDQRAEYETIDVPYSDTHCSDINNRPINHNEPPLLPMDTHHTSAIMAVDAAFNSALLKFS